MSTGYISIKLLCSPLALFVTSYDHTSERLYQLLFLSYLKRGVHWLTWKQPWVLFDLLIRLDDFSEYYLWIFCLLDSSCELIRRCDHTKTWIKIETYTLLSGTLPGLMLANLWGDLIFSLRIRISASFSFFRTIYSASIKFLSGLWPICYRKGDFSMSSFWISVTRGSRPMVLSNEDFYGSKSSNFLADILMEW